MVSRNNAKGKEGLLYYYPSILPFSWTLYLATHFFRPGGSAIGTKTTT